MQQAFSWDIFQNARGPKAEKKLAMINLTLTPPQLGAAVTIHPVPPDKQQHVYEMISGFRSEFQHTIDKVRSEKVAHPYREHVVEWNCTIKVAGNRDEVAVNGICQQNALMRPPLAGKVRTLSG